MRTPAAPSLKRRSPSISPALEIVIACEGRVTEKEYLNKCKSEYGAGTVKLRWLPISGVPMTVVAAAIEERNLRIERARRQKDSFDVFRVWAVFDRDEHPAVGEALELAKAHGVDVAFSNPCFELWPILHMRDYGALSGRHEVQRLLHELMPKYHHDNSPIVDFDCIKGDVDVACQRASLLIGEREKEGDPDGCPVTTVGVLIQKIIENGKGKFSRIKVGGV